MSELEKPNNQNLKIFAALLFILYGLGIFWGLPSEVSPAIDSPLPYSPLAFVGEYSNPQIAKTYPAVHQILMLPFYAVVFVFLKIIGSLQTLSTTWPYGFQDPSTAFSSLILISRILCLVMAIIVILSLRHLNVRDSNDTSRWISMLLLATSGVFTYYSRVGNLDIPYIFWWALSLVFLWRHVFEIDVKAKNLALCAVFSALSMGTKDQAAGLVAGSVLVFLFVGAYSERNWVLRIKSTLFFLLVTFLVYIAVAILPQPFRWAEHLQVYFGVFQDDTAFWSEKISNYQEFGYSFSDQLKLAGKTISSISHVISPLGIFLSVIGGISLIRSRRYRELAVLLLPAFAYYGLIIVNFRIVRERYVLPLAFLLVILAGLGASLLLNHFERRGRRLLMLGKIGVFLVLFYQFISGYLPVTYVQFFDMKRSLARSISNHVPKDSVILWLGGGTGLPNSNVYENYQLILPEEAEPWSRTVDHVFRSYDSNFVYILSQRPLKGDFSRTDLLGVWQYPKWIKGYIHVPSVKEFFLYKRNPHDP